MSDYEYKVVLRYCDENINSRREHLEKMRQWTGQEPRWIEEEDGDVLFSYMPLTEKGTRVRHTPKDKPFFHDVSSTRDGHTLYGVELVLAWTVGEPIPPVAIHQRDLDRLRHELERTVDCEPWQVSFLSYGWHNCGDEPIEW